MIPQWCQVEDMNTSIAKNQTLTLQNNPLPIALTSWWKSQIYAAWNHRTSALVTPVVSALIESTDESDWVNSNTKFRLSFAYIGENQLTSYRIYVCVIGI